MRTLLNFTKKSKMRDIRLLGDIVKHKLADFNIPIRTYIGIENVLLLIISAKLHYTIPIPFFGFVDHFQSLTIVIIGVVYGYQTSLRGISIYLALGLIGLPVFEQHEAGLTYILQNNKLGLMLGYFLASVVAATLSTYHWDRKFHLAILLFFLCITVIHVIRFSFLSLSSEGVYSAQHLLEYALSSITIETLIGAAFTSLCWHLSYSIFPELRNES